MEIHIRNAWIMAGKTIQTFTKINNTKMHDIARQAQLSASDGNYATLQNIHLETKTELKD